MRVAVHAGQLLQPVPGGIGRYVRSLLGALPGAGVDPVPFGAGPAPAGLPGDLPERWHDLGRPGGGLRYELWHRLRRPAVGVPGGVVHATSLAVPPAGGRPLVVTVHDLVVLRQPEHLTRRGVAFHRRGLELTRREASVVVVPSEFGRDDLARAGFDPARVQVAPHGVELPAPAPDPAAVLQGLGIRPPYLLFVSTIEPRKGVGDVLEAHRRLRRLHPDLGLVLVGAPGWGPPPDLGGPGVLAVGRVDDDSRLDVLYRQAVALAHPASYEGFGLTPLEAMARGCPVVVSDAACLPEVVGDGGIVVPTGDVGALADALGGLIGGGAERARWSAAGLARAGGFTWEASALAHRRAYEAARDLGPEGSGGR
ncbi:MAG: glycosyltransferase family 4 protein [Acidimicrobiia bacterium]